MILLKMLTLLVSPNSQVVNCGLFCFYCRQTAGVTMPRITLSRWRKERLRVSRRVVVCRDRHTHAPRLANL